MTLTVSGLFCADWLAKKNYRPRFKTICLSVNRFFFIFLEIKRFLAEINYIIFVPFLFYLEQFKEPATKPITWAPIAGGSVAGVVLLVIVLMAIIWQRRSAPCPFNYQGN